MFAVNSMSSAWRATASRRVSIPSPFKAEMGTHWVSPSPLLRGDTRFRQLRFDPFKVGPLLVHFVDGHNNRSFGIVTKLNGLSGLGHNTIVCGHNQDNNIRHIGPPLPHGGKSLVPGRIQKCQRLVFNPDLVGTDMLGNSAGLPLGNFGISYKIQQGLFSP